MLKNLLFLIPPHHDEIQIKKSRMYLFLFFFVGPGKKTLVAGEKPPRKSSGLSRVEEVLTLKLYTAIEDFYSEETGNKFLKKGDKVEVLDTSRPEFWLVRRVSRGSEIGFVRHTCLQKDDDG